jgi:hypothetical protein
MKKQLLFTLIALFSTANVYSQKCANLNIQHQADIATTCNKMTMTMQHDAQDRPYLYVAKKEGGFDVYEISDIKNPVLKKNIPLTDLGNMHVMNVSQQGSYLYLALGNHFVEGDKPGIAIIDVTNPETPTVTDVYETTFTDGGCGIVKAEGNYAYMGAMRHGLIVLDITNKNDIKFISRIKPDINYPTPNPNEDLYNARGMVVKDGIVYLCFDAGGLRIINTADKQNPSEIGRYSNPTLNGKPRAYNNIILDGDNVYITVDYCGLEVLNIANPADIKVVSWWNPWDCHTNPANWFSSPGHTNEIAMDRDNKLLFMSTGKSDLIVVDIDNPAAPDSCSFFGGVNNSIGTWGVSLHKDKVFLSYICSFVPFSSNWTGVKALTYNTPAPPSSVKEHAKNYIKAYPNPATNVVAIELDEKIQSAEIVNTLGQSFPTKYDQSGNVATFGVVDLPKGIYYIQLTFEDRITTVKFVK